MLHILYLYCCVFILNDVLSMFSSSITRSGTLSFTELYCHLLVNSLPCLMNSPAVIFVHVCVISLSCIYACTCIAIRTIHATIECPSQE